MSFKWKITLANSSVKNEELNKFDLAWEKEDAVKEISLVGEEGEYRLSLSNGKFEMKDGKKWEEIDAGIGKAKSLIFRRRNKILLDRTMQQSVRVEYIMGYKNKDNKMRVLFLVPVTLDGKVVEPIKHKIEFRDTY